MTEIPPAVVCPPWCEADHRMSREHVSAEVRREDVVIELIQYFDEREPIVSINEVGEWTRRVAELPLSLVRQLPELVAALAPPADAQILARNLAPGTVSHHDLGVLDPTPGRRAGSGTMGW